MTQVWWVVGDAEKPWEWPTLFETKECAEIYARKLFPDEDAKKRYQRIFCRPVLTPSDLNGG
jgi:hypothetical protein